MELLYVDPTYVRVYNEQSIDVYEMRNGMYVMKVIVTVSRVPRFVGRMDSYYPGREVDIRGFHETRIFNQLKEVILYACRYTIQ